jgi:hypothetical protein
MQKRVTLSFDSEVYEDFQKVCRDQDIVVSKRIERLMKEESVLIEKNKREKK